jgi:hypothetical protein
MSWATCYNGSNNIHHKQPPMMSDARLFTRWETACNKNNEIMRENNVTTNYDYRQYLIKNGGAIRDSNAMLAHSYVGASNFDSSQPFHNRYLFQSNTDRNQPYGYEGSNLKNEYISRQELNANMNTPFITQAELFNMSRNN